MFEVQAMGNAVKFDFQISLDLFNRAFFTGVADRKINFTEAADAQAALKSQWVPPIAYS
jgi:hypothetical protein